MTATNVAYGFWSHDLEGPGNDYGELHWERDGTKEERKRDCNMAAVVMAEIAKKFGVGPR